MKTLESDLIKYEIEANSEIYYPCNQKNLYTDKIVNNYIKNNIKRINILKYINNLETELQFIENLGQLKEGQ